MNLAGKTIVVTGGGHGIGRAYVMRFAREGANVLCADIDGPAASRVAQEASGLPGMVHASHTDVTVFGQVEEMAAQAAKTFGPITGLVNNAGMLNVVPISRLPFDEIADEEWDRVFASNVKSAWYCCRAVVPSMRAAGRGSIVNVTSSTFFLGPPTRIHYVASKAAVVGFTRTLARELGPYGIRVNALSPGSTLSEENPSPEVIRMREENARGRALLRVEVPEDVVGAAVFLMSEDSSFITGQTLVVDGGAVMH
jgi:3-oxoacyl-[acyl-carrier protein] reductase